MKLIENWKASWRLFSVQAMAISSAGLATWAVLPEDLKAALPHWLVPMMAAVTMILGIVGRLILQPASDPDKTDTK